MSSCLGCKYLFSIDIGYSNYTVEDTEIDCALDKNANLPASVPYDWNENADYDNWKATNASRCDMYAKGDRISFDVDGEVDLSKATDDADVIAALTKKGYAQ